jgi:signal transduction histidine kinase
VGPAHPALAAWYRAPAVAIGVAVTALGAATLLGWALGVQHSFRYGAGPLMKPNAAAALIAGGLALSLSHLEGRLRSLSRALAGATVAISVATLAEWILGVDLGFDEILFRDDTGAYTSVPGRIAPNTALAFSMLGTALLLVRSDGWRLRLSRTLAVVALAIGAIAVAGYLYRVSPLFAVAKRTGMALPAAIGLIVLSVGVLLARTDAGVPALVRSEGSGGVLLRRLLPTAALAPIVLALPAQAGVTAGILDQAYASALVTVGLTGILVGVVVGAAREVEARDAALRETAERLAAREVELSASNRELEAFGYSVSHDLRSPLRTIDGFGQALVEDCAEAIPPVGVGHVGRIRAATQRMGKLIDDLLHLSRVTRVEMSRERVDLSAAAREVAAELRRTAPERRVTVEVEDGLVARGDPALLRIVLENLLGNAWKFTSKHASARIAVGGAARGGVPAFYVRDDGAGFEMAYAHKLFGAFQRLHGAGEFAGTGIGLATVQRIVRRHGGEIWAEGALEQGATFTFTLSGEPRSEGEAS